ncbi:hypothetical protein ACI782_01800 [Geodermatophilus sp. SYSU D00703]
MGLHARWNRGCRPPSLGPRWPASGVPPWSVTSRLLWLHGLPLWGVGLGRVHVTRRPPASSEVGRLPRSHVARLRDDEVVTVDGVAVTSPVRTALDLARTLPLEPAVVVLDAFLAGVEARHEELRTALADMAGTRGSRSAARAVDLADGRSESVGESRSRILLHRLGSTPSTLQRRSARPMGC